MSYRLIRPLLFALDPERAHNLSIAALRMTPTAHPLPADPMLESQVAGLRFPNPVGLAAGYDKDGRVAHKMHSLGFGFAELGTLTPLAQPGNPQPRLFRLVEDRAVINRFGFNNGGQGAAADRIARYRRPKGEGPVIGINIGANKDATAAGRGIADYVTGVTCMMPLADYLTVNISSPNTPGLRNLQYGDALDALLKGLKAAQEKLTETHGRYVPLFIKIAPDLSEQEISSIAASLLNAKMDGVIATNTTLSRDAVEGLDHAEEAGGLSGAVLTQQAEWVTQRLSEALGREIPIIGVGGIDSAKAAQDRLNAGASLVQVYSAFIYQGPVLIKSIARAI